MDYATDVNEMLKGGGCDQVLAGLGISGCGLIDAEQSPRKGKPGSDVSINPI